MSNSLPDPLALWARANGAPAQVIDAETLASSMQALWRHQEELLRSLGQAFGQPQMAELAVELMLHPLIRQAQLLELAPVPNPKQAVFLGRALNAWLSAQFVLASAAALDIQGDQSASANVSVLQAWVWAFARRQASFLDSCEGQSLFAQLCVGWMGLDVSLPQTTADNAPQLKRLGSSARGKDALLILSGPWCPLASIGTENCRMLANLNSEYDLHVIDWGDLRRADAERLRQLGGALAAGFLASDARAKVLNIAEHWMPNSSDGVRSLPLLDKGSRIAPLLRSEPVQLIRPWPQAVAGELLAVLCDAVYPDWAVHACLQGEQSLSLRRAWLAAMPCVSSNVLLDIARTQAGEGRGGDTAGARCCGHKEADLLQVLNGESEKLLRAVLSA